MTEATRPKTCRWCHDPLPPYRRRFCSSQCQRSSKTREDLFTVLGKVAIVEGRKRFVPNSPAHMTAQIAKLPVGKELGCTFSQHIPTRSDSQLSYHFVLLGYIADHTGYTKEELHDAIMRIKFGTKRINLAGETVEVRQSIRQRPFPAG